MECNEQRIGAFQGYCTMRLSNTEVIVSFLGEDE